MELVTVGFSDKVGSRMKVRVRCRVKERVGRRVKVRVGFLVKIRVGFRVKVRVGFRSGLGLWQIFILPYYYGFLVFGK